MIWRQFKNPKFYSMVAVDVLISCAAIVAAYVMRLDFNIMPRHWRQIRYILSVGIPIRFVVFTMFGLYRGMWRYTGVKDLLRLLQAVVTAELLLVAVIVYRFRFAGFSLLIFFMDSLFVFMLAAGLRMAIRSFFGLRNMQSGRSGWKVLIPEKRDRDRVIIIGAGDAGVRILNEVHDNPRLNYEVACFLDDDPQKNGRTLRGVPVFGCTEDLPVAVKQYDASHVFIAVPSATGSQMRRIVEMCEKASVPFKTLPTISEIIDERVSLKVLRDVDYRDLLGRLPVELDEKGIDQCLLGSAVLVTGCGGSIGAELCRQILRFHPSLMLLLDSCELNLFQIEMELRDERGFQHYKALLGQVQDEALMERVFREYRPDVVLHAAAYKHVPMLEQNPWEAVVNNIQGSRTVMDAARRHGAGRFVLVSTDKAVRPTSVMGASKRVSEIVMQMQPPCKTKFMAVRFGNVLGSTGSVVPHFRRQIERGGPVTVTHKDITRYFMTIPEATQLILQAMAMGEGGDIFVLEMGTPVRILDMAKDLVRLSGKEPERDIEIIFTGLRPGEKLYEELITADEDVFDTQHDKIKRLRSERSSVPRYAMNNREQFNEDLRELIQMAQQYDAVAIREKLKVIVPEFVSPERIPGNGQLRL